MKAFVYLPWSHLHSMNIQFKLWNCPIYSVRDQSAGTPLCSVSAEYVANQFRMQTHANNELQKKKVFENLKTVSRLSERHNPLFDASLKNAVGILNSKSNQSNRNFSFVHTWLIQRLPKIKLTASLFSIVKRNFENWIVSQIKAKSQNATFRWMKSAECIVQISKTGFIFAVSSIAGANSDTRHAVRLISSIRFH